MTEKTAAMSDNSAPSQKIDSQDQTQSVASILNRPTADVLNEQTQEAVEVVAFAIEESKTVGGFGTTILTVCALVASSPWSWIAALVFGPIRVWAFAYSLVIGGIGTAIALLVTLILVLGITIIAFAAAVVL